MTNEELVLIIRNGQTEGYGELWQRCRRLLYHLLGRRLKHVALPNYISVEDLEQCMFFALQKAVSSYDPDKPYLFNSYLKYSVINTIREHLPKGSIQETSANQPVQSDAENEIELIELITDDNVAVRFEDMEHIQLQTVLREAIKQLPQQERECIVLSYYHDLSYQQISEKTGYSSDTARKSVALGLYHLKQNKALRAFYGQTRQG